MVLSLAGLRPAGAVPEPSELEALVRSLRCSGEAFALLESFPVTGEILRAAPGPGGAGTFRLATSRVGVWITLHIDRGGREATIVRTAPDKEGQVDFDRGCRPKAKELPPRVAAVAGDGYTDADLAAELRRSGRLAVFLWSPHMPLSVDALFEIEAATRSLGVTLVALTDPASNRSYVAEISESRGIRAEARRPLASIELLFRDLPLHAPALILFHEGKVTAPLPGYRNRDAYLRFMRSILDP